MPDVNVANYKEQGGARDVIGGSLDVVSGGEIDFESGSALKIAAVTVTVSADEVNQLDGAAVTAADFVKLHAITATSTQLNRTSVTTAGVVEASKVVVVDANKKIDTLDVTTPLIGGVTVTATAAQINRTGVTTAGTVEASKAVVVGANKDVDVFRIETMLLGAVTVTVTGTNLNNMVKSTTVDAAVTAGEVAFTGSISFATGLATVVAVVASQVSTPSVTDGMYVTATKGTTAGWVEVFSWRPTAAGDAEPTAGAASITAAWAAHGT